MRVVLALAIIFIAAGVIGLIVINYYSYTPTQPGIFRTPFRGLDGRTPFSSLPPFDTFVSNGEQIFFTGTSSRGTITTTRGPFWFQMHGGGCATCHGPDGRGGRVTMMGSFTSPNITYKVLTGEEEGNHEEEHEPYTDTLIKRAITRGIEPDGEELDRNMPRWQMSDKDINDLIEYLKTLDL